MKLNRYSLEILFFLQKQKNPISFLNMCGQLNNPYPGRMKLLRTMATEGLVIRTEVKRGDSLYSITNVGRVKLMNSTEWKLREGGTIVRSAPVADWKSSTLGAPIFAPARIGAADFLKIQSKGF